MNRTNSKENLENYSWMLENFGVNIDPVITVQNVLKSRHGNGWESYWIELLEYHNQKVKLGKAKRSVKSPKKR